MKKIITIFCLLLLVTGCDKKNKNEEELEHLTCYIGNTDEVMAEKTVYIFGKDSKKIKSFELKRPRDISNEEEKSDEDIISSAKLYCDQYAANIAGDKTSRRYKNIRNDIECSADIEDNVITYTIKSKNFDTLDHKYDYEYITIDELQEQILEKDSRYICKID